MCYIVTGWNYYGKQITGCYEAKSEAEAERMFIEDIGGGEVNEVFDN